MKKHLNAVNARFNRELDDFKTGIHKGDLHLGKPLSILKSAGLKEGEITVTPSVLHQHLKKHNLTTDDLKGLAKFIQYPMLVYQHGKNIPSTIIITEMTTDGKKLSVAVRLENKGRNLTVNEIASIHRKDAVVELERLSKLSDRELEKNVKWIEREQALDWLGFAPSSGASSQANQRLNSVAKILQNFENPKFF